MSVTKTANKFEKDVIVEKKSKKKCSCMGGFCCTHFGAIVCVSACVIFFDDCSKFDARSLQYSNDREQ